MTASTTLLTPHAAAAHIQHGGVIAYPTESVWGLGCDPYQEQAVRQLLALKQRNVAQGVILVAANIAQIEHLLTGLTLAQRARVLASWPGAYTWLLPLHDSIPQWISGAHPRVAVRVSAHPDVQALCAAFGGVVVSTSANPSGQPPARSAAEAQLYFAEHVGYMAGEIGDAPRPSTIRDSLSDRLIRD